MSKVDVKEMYQRMKYNKIQLNEDLHCPMLLEAMSNSDKGSFTAFCVEAGIGEKKFYEWLMKSELFATCYGLGKMISRENWEDLGRQIRDEVNMPGTVNHKFEYWRSIGWNRFGIGKNSRIRLNLKSTDTPNQHYEQLINQASEGDFTAGEIKQLMEAINVGLNTHQVFALQKEIDQLKSDLATMSENSNAHNIGTNKGIA
jgi:hypothetical protein